MRVFQNSFDQSQSDKEENGNERWTYNSAMAARSEEKVVQENVGLCPHLRSTCVSGHAVLPVDPAFSSHVYYWA